eukprot:875336-Prorocentrum_minimum.AAC.1
MPPRRPPQAIPPSEPLQGSKSDPCWRECFRLEPRSCRSDAKEWVLRAERLPCPPPAGTPGKLTLDTPRGEAVAATRPAENHPGAPLIMMERGHVRRSVYLLPPPPAGVSLQGSPPRPSPTRYSV